MKREVDLTPNNAFSNGFRLSGSDGNLFDPDKDKEIKKKRTPWEKTDEELADKKNILDSIYSYSTTFSVNTGRQNVAIRMIEDMIDDFIIVENDFEFEQTHRTIVSDNTTSNSFTMVNTWSDNWINSSSQPATVISNGNRFTFTYTDHSDDIWYQVNNKWKRIPRDKNMRFTTDGGYFILGHADEIRAKHDNANKLEKQYNEYNTLKGFLKSLDSSYIFKKIGIYNEPKVHKYDKDERWNVKPHQIKPLSHIERLELKKDFYLGRRPPKLIESFPYKYNAFEFFIFEDEDNDGFERRMYSIGDKHVLLPEGVVKYKGHDYADNHRKESWQPDGRVKQKWDNIFSDSNKNWDLDLEPLVEALPAIL
jgi:hypothetical protein